METRPQQIKMRGNGGFTGLFKTYKSEFFMFFVLVGIFVVMQVITGRALTSNNLLNVFQAAAPYLIMAMGELMIVVTAGIDLSVGSIFSLSGMAGTLAMINFGIAPGVIVALFVGFACGACNGLLVAKLKMAPFIATLAMYSAAASLTFIIAGGNSQTITNAAAFGEFDKGSFFFGVPNYIFYMVVIVIVMQFVMRKTLFGRWVYATGSNESAAHLVGVPTSKVKFLAYAMCGVFCGLAAMLNASYLMTVECTAGVSMEMSVIAATVIGGASLSGGLGTPVGAAIGAMIIVAIRNGINLMGINSFWNGTITGIVLVIAVLIGMMSEKKKKNG
ncbi:MAG: ABC transporter permease [Christensenella sp.]|nr:ABC transporter permease [Christensenella sp.]